MKSTFKTLLAGVALLGVMASAASAEDFVVDHKKHEQHHSMMVKQHAVKAPITGYVPGRFSGSSAYTGGKAGQVAFQTDKIGDMDGRAFTVRPVRGSGHEFNASLRYGDTSQSRDTRFNHSFNN